MYTAAGQPTREQLVQRFMPLVKRIAYHLMARLPPSVQFDDLVQNGMLGLLDAIDRYQEGFGAQFETYATQRTRGAMLDGLRENDWLPRNLRRELRRIESAINQLEHAHGRAPTERELAEALGMTLAEYQKTLQEARGHQLVYLEDFSGDGDEDFLDRHSFLQDCMLVKVSCVNIFCPLYFTFVRHQFSCHDTHKRGLTFTICANKSDMFSLKKAKRNI